MIPKFNPKLCQRAGKWSVQNSGEEEYAIFYPNPLPPNPSLQHDDSQLQDLLDKANRGLGRLDGITHLLPDPALFLYMYARKEAVLSSQIEGTQSSLSDLLLFENKAESEIPVDDVREVSNYVKAMNRGLVRLKTFPLSLRLVREIHAVLLKDVRGANKEPGEFRSSQNWIGGSRPGNAIYVPPPPQEIMSVMGALEKFWHGEPIFMPTLIKAGLVHAQFESIHPFLDGNGRLGRLLITFILCAEKAISQPLLYLSLYFKREREKYYSLLQKIRTHGAWEEWLKFYLTGVEQVATEASETAKKIVNLFEADQQKIHHLKKAAGTALRLHALLKRKAFMTPVIAQKELALTYPAISKGLANLEKLGIVREITGKQTYKVYIYDKYYQILKEGTETD